ncbi:MAG: hypothetical protein JXA41_05800, partial [Deltaproteobacteria bacterium]|nr:hypothetical protein [Deltaproteobacteria bacterium]
MGELGALYFPQDLFSSVTMFRHEVLSPNGRWSIQIKTQHFFLAFCEGFTIKEMLKIEIIIWNIPIRT